MGVPVEVVGRPSRGEGRVPGSGGLGWEVGLEGGEEDEERPMLRLRKDIVQSRRRVRELVKNIGTVGELQEFARVPSVFECF